jgi:cytochrome d ubiquinol oxidase subunit I
MDFVVYPVNDFGPLMKGVVIGGLGIFHVFTAQFAIGGGFLMCYLQWLAMTGRSPHARQFLDGYFKFLILLSFIAGALTGVGMWFTSIQVSPQTIGKMIDIYHWVWAIEWTFFCLEVVAGYAFYRYAHQLTDAARMTLLALYTLAAWMSLFWINGILSWQLTPGQSFESASIWTGFFNAGFWPSLFYRTIASFTCAALVAMVVINCMPEFDRQAKTELINRVAIFLAPMVLMPVLGVWYLATMPADSRSWVLGGSIAMTMFMGIAVISSALIGAYALWGLIYQKLYVNAATAVLLVLLAAGATAGGEFVREGVRKPFSIRNLLYSNGVTIDKVDDLRRTGWAAYDKFPLRDEQDYPHPQLKAGALVFRQQCSACHTVEGMNAISHLSKTWTVEQKRLMFAQLQKTKPFMPPFSGTPEELEAVVQYFEWVIAGRPKQWNASSDSPDYAAVLARVQGFLDEAGTAPASEQDRARAIAQGKGRR